MCLYPCTCRCVGIFACMRHFLKIKKLLTIVSSEECCWDSKRSLGLFLFVLSALIINELKRFEKVKIFLLNKLPKDIESIKN